MRVSGRKSGEGKAGKMAGKPVQKWLRLHLSRMLLAAATCNTAATAVARRLRLSACYNAAAEHLEWGIHLRDSSRAPSREPIPNSHPSRRSTDSPFSSICTRIPSVSGCDCPLSRAVHSGRDVSLSRGLGSGFQQKQQKTTAKIIYNCG